MSSGDQKPETASTASSKSYKDSMTGYFSGMLQWKQFDDLWDILRASPQNWYVYQPDTGDTPPESPLSPEEFQTFLSSSAEFLRDQQYADYCGAVYADSASSPSFIKVFHPRKMGSGCSLGGKHEPILPHWTISKIKPELMRTKKEEKQPAKNLLEKIGIKRTQ